jgi:long-chain acyl-CoA synthetase
MLSSDNIVINAIQGIARFEIGPQERVFCALPLFHSLPQNICMWSAMIVGATAIIVEKIERRTLLKGIAQKPTMVVAVPALYGLFCMLKTIRFGNVKYFLSGGDALSDKIRGLFELIYGRKLCNGYGLTEASPFIAIDVDDYTQPTNTIGKPFVGIEVSIRDEHGEELRKGSIGTLWIRGPNIMLGYYKAPEATRAIIKNGWLNTGDLAYLTSTGKIVLAGRERDLISNKGLKIYPQEVENILLTHPQVLQAAVIGIRDSENEEIPVAFIASKEQDTLTLIEQLRALCSRSLASYKIPRQYYIRRELPVTTTGKVNKKLLLAELRGE